jgi:hypothetical protein
MTQWTDERLGALLTDTFAAHERDADPAVAHRLALTTPAAPRRRWTLVAAAAAAVALIIGLVVYASHPRELDPVPAPAIPPATTEGHNRALATAEAGRVLADIPVPPGATRSDSAPARALRRLGAYNEPLDPSLTRTRWWVVPLSYRDLVAWYDAHSAADVSSAYGPSSSSPAADGDLYWPVPGHSASYSTPSVVVSYTRLGPDTTAVRTDATLAARYDRTADTLLPATATSIDITKAAIDGEPRPSPTSVTVADPKAVASLVAAFNNLEGAFVHEPTPCGSPVGIVYTYAVTFHWPDHVLAVDPGAELCGVGRGLTLDGTELTPTLENDHAFDRILEAAVDGSSVGR